MKTSILTRARGYSLKVYKQLRLVYPDMTALSLSPSTNRRSFNPMTQHTYYHSNVNGLDLGFKDYGKFFVVPGIPTLYAYYVGVSQF